MDEQEVNERNQEMKPEGTQGKIPGEPEPTSALTRMPIEAHGPAPQETAAPILSPDTRHPNPVLLSVPPHDVLPIVEGDEAAREMRRISRRSFLWAGVAVVSVFAGQHWLNTRSEDNGIVWPLRRSLDINDQIVQDYFREARLSPTFPRARAVEPRQNGDYGVDTDVDPDWKLSFSGLPDKDEPLMITLASLKKLPKTEIVTELKCIEGWSVVVQWAGVRFADFIAHYWPKDHPLTELPAYVAMETPDGAYYVGLDKASAMHPQTLLCYEMNGKTLTDEHGAPLRLAIPVKYGIKNIKRIGTIRLTDARPKDYWAEQGYDWYAGH